MLQKIYIIFNFVIYKFIIHPDKKIYYDAIYILYYVIKKYYA